MYFAPISPIAYLDRYSGRSHVQMCVGCWAVKYPEYYEWYKRRRLAGDFVFLDNGAYEGELVGPDEYEKLVRDLNPQVYALPDKIDDEAETQRLQLDFLKRITTSRSSLAMRVLQSAERDTSKWIEIYRRSQAMFKWIAFPRVLGTQRQVIINACTAVRNPATRIHAFGWTGSVAEVNALARQGVDTMDSAGPVWRGIMGTKNGNAWVDVPFDPSFEFCDINQEELYGELADSNLSEVFRAAVGL